MNEYQCAHCHDGMILAALQSERRDLQAPTRALLSRAPAQPAAPAADANMCWHCHVVLEPLPRPQCENCLDECDVDVCPAPGCAVEQPAAPEPSADYACADMQGPVVTDRQAAVMWMRRAETAEAQLAAVRGRCAAALVVLESGLQSRNYRAFAVRVLEALTPGGGTGEGEV